MPARFFYLTPVLLVMWLAALCMMPLTTRAQLPASDTASDKNASVWKTADPSLYIRRPFSDIKLYPDSSVHTLHRRPYLQPWARDLGNFGSPVYNMAFKPLHNAGLSLGYHSFDAYRFVIDSLGFYNTDHPYAAFTYNLGSKLEQRAEIFHTQNIKPYWNVAVDYRKINSPGYYFTQRTNHDNFYINSNYQSPGKRYEMYISLAYNKEQFDENGGIVSDTFLRNPQYAQKKSIPVQFFSSGFSNTRSPVAVLFRDITFRLNHGYTWGRIDTTYNEDSTAFDARLRPRFRINHIAEIGSQRYQYKDLRPDSLRYDALFQQSFLAEDSVFTRQEWFYTDNRLLINGILGKESRAVVVNAGAGVRVDQFKTLSLNTIHSDNILSNYLIGSLYRETADPRAWTFSADVRFVFSGAAAGNLNLGGQVEKTIWDFARLRVGVQQQIVNAPYNYTYFGNQFWSRASSFNKESITQLTGHLDIDKYHFSVGLRNYVLSNYFYFNNSQAPDQWTSAINLSQLSARKVFYFGNFVLDNELLYQEMTSNEALNLPRFLGRHQLSVETRIFKKQLKIATGAQVLYHSAFYANGYSPFFNQFYYQNTYSVRNQPMASVFFNFQIKRFRAYIMFDQVQQFFNENFIITRGYAAQDAMLRFGFNWVLVD